LGEGTVPARQARDARDGAVEGIHTDERLSDTAIRGVYPEYGEMRNEIPMEGRWISPEDIAERRRVAFLGAILRRKLSAARRLLARPCASTA